MSQSTYLTVSFVDGLYTVRRHRKGKYFLYTLIIGLYNLIKSFNKGLYNLIKSFNKGLYNLLFGKQSKTFAVYSSV